jgi:hypothetical protein
MKQIFLNGFRGTSFQVKEFAQEHGLIRAGHVGFAFEDNPEFVFGFHPTAEAIEAVGGEVAAIEWLKENQPLQGILQADYAVFERAFDLHEQGARTEVWFITIEVPDAEYERIRAQAIQWYTEKTIFTYAFPERGQAPKPYWDNCATFPRRLTLPLPEPTGQLSRYIQALETQGRKWKPKGRSF